MKLKMALLCFATLSLCSLVVADSSLKLKTFTDPRRAVKAAQEDKKQIVFFLIDNQDDKQVDMLNSFTEELNRFENVYVLVKCTSNSTNNRNMFTETFKKTIDELPVVVVTDSVGKEIADGKGTDFSVYEKMLIDSQIKGGVITDPLELSVLKGRLKKVGQEPARIAEGFLMPLAEDLEQKRVPLSPVRTWRKNDKTSFKGLLIQANGDRGEFIDVTGESLDIKFTDLTKSDINYLTSILK